MRILIAMALAAAAGVVVWLATRRPHEVYVSEGKLRELAAADGDGMPEAIGRRSQARRDVDITSAYDKAYGQ